MFLVRSAFWLTVAFIAMNPHHVDIGAAASQLSGEALATGQRLVVSQMLQPQCPLLGCVAPSAAAAPVLASRPAPVAADAAPAAPFPLPRPARLS